MSRSLNKAILIGNVGSDPEVRTVGSTKVAEFSVATSRTWTDKQGNQQEKTEWHRCQAWEKTAELVERLVKKGSRLYVEGAIEYRSYEDKEGQTKYVTEIKVRDFILLGDKAGGSTADAPRGSTARGGSTAKGSTAPAPAPWDGDDDLPF